MSFETALVESAGGNFGLVLLGFLVFSIVGGFLYTMKSIVDQNLKFNQQIVDNMKDVVSSIKEYHRETLESLEKHDMQAKAIQTTCNETLTTLRNRPCVANGKK